MFSAGKRVKILLRGFSDSQCAFTNMGKKLAANIRRGFVIRQAACSQASEMRRSQQRACCSMYRFEVAGREERAEAGHHAVHPMDFHDRSATVFIGGRTSEAWQKTDTQGKGKW